MKKNINRQLQHQKTNLETVSMLSSGQLLTGLEVRSWGKILLSNCNILKFNYPATYISGTKIQDLTFFGVNMFIPVVVDSLLQRRCEFKFGEVIVNSGHGDIRLHSGLQDESSKSSQNEWYKSDSVYIVAGVEIVVIVQYSENYQKFRRTTSSSPMDYHKIVCHVILLKTNLISEDYQISQVGRPADYQTFLSYFHPCWLVPLKEQSF